ncbi:hypothetical protein [Scytonema sp. PRP1]
MKSLRLSAVLPGDLDLVAVNQQLRDRKSNWIGVRLYLFQSQSWRRF